MNAWFIFWVVSVAVALLLFAIIAVVVVIGGWRDMIDLFRQLYSNQRMRLPDAPPSTDIDSQSNREER